MKLVLLTPNQPPREIPIVAVNGRRLVTKEGVWVMSPASDELGQRIAESAPLPDFTKVEVSPVIAPPDLTKEFPQEAEDLYRLHLTYCNEHNLKPSTRDQHKKSEQDELEQKFGLPDDVRPFCLTDKEGVALAREETEVRWRASFTKGSRVTKWFLEDFQPVAPLFTEAQITEPAERIGQHEALANRDRQSIAKRESLANRDDQHIQKRELMAGTDGETLGKLEAVTKKLGATADSVRKATEIGDLYSNPTMADAKDAAIRRGVPKEFVAYCFTEMHIRKFPSVGQAGKAIVTQPIFKDLRQGPHSRPTVWRWICDIKEELVTRGLREPRTKAPAAKPAAGYDLEEHPAPTLDEAEQETDDPQSYS